MITFLINLLPMFFGSSSNGKGILGVVEQFIPSIASKEKDKEANADSQNDARNMKFKSHDSWLDILIDGWNRSIRPMITTGLVGIWFGWWKAPDLTEIHPFYINMTLIVFTFWFGGRFVTKDVLPMIEKWRENKRKKSDELLSDYDSDDYAN